MNDLLIKPNTPFARALMWVARAAAGEGDAASLQCVRISRDTRECLGRHGISHGVILDATDGYAVHTAHVPDIDISDLWVRDIALGDRGPILVPHQAIAQCATSVVHLQRDHGTVTWWADRSNLGTMPRDAQSMRVGHYPKVELFHDEEPGDSYLIWVDAATLVVGITDSDARSVIMSDDNSLPHHLCCPTDDGEEVMLSWLTHVAHRDFLYRCPSRADAPRVWDAESLKHALQGIEEAVITVWPDRPHCQVVPMTPEYADIALMATVRGVRSLELGNAA